jgi:hypothetical protein
VRLYHHQAALRLRDTESLGVRTPLRVMGTPLLGDSGLRRGRVRLTRRAPHLGQRTDKGRTSSVELRGLVAPVRVLELRDQCVAAGGLISAVHFAKRRLSSCAVGADRERDRRLLEPTAEGRHPR